MSYQTEPWFPVLQSACVGRTRQAVACMLGISGPTLSQVLNGSGKYGDGTAKTDAIANRVLHTFGGYPCPHLSEEAGGVDQVITAEQCRAFAHRAAPTGSPRDMRHWQACRTCPHKAASAPATPKPVKPRSTHDAV